MPLVRFTDISPKAWTWIDDYQVVEADTLVVASLNRLENEADELLGNAAEVGVKLASDEEAERLAPYVDRLSLVALDFPTFTDGRSYSNARILREHYGYQGELRAVGDVLADQLRFMLRCGFDSAELAPRVSPEAAERALKRFSVVYQAASDDAAPAHRLRRVAKSEPLWDVGL